MKLMDKFQKVARAVANVAGSPWGFLSASLIVIVWGLTGPLFGYSDTWQLVINTGTTIVTFLMVFLIQSTQNRDGEAMQLKLDELIRAIGTARNELFDLENMSEAEVAKVRADFDRDRKSNADGAAVSEGPPPVVSP